MIDVLLACHPDRIIPESVMTSILTQGIAVDIHICAHIGDGAWKSRQYLLEQWRSKPKKGQFVLTMDNDIILPIGAIKKQVDFLCENPDFAAIGISKQFNPPSVAEEPHVDASPLLFISGIYETLNYRFGEYCECMYMTRDLRELGYRIGFIDGLKCDHLIT